jgi:hypothetical protein
MTPDDYYMNFAYVSEKWLFEYMTEHYADSDNEEWLEQIEDERKHTLMCEGALRKQNVNYYKDTTKSIEHAIYGELGNFYPKNDEEFSALSWIVEKRALFLYRYYMRNGNNDLYKKITQGIIDDEMKHVGFHNEEITPSHERIRDIDKAIFTAFNETYGRKGMFGQEFWEDLFTGKLKEKVHVKLP